MTSDNDNQINDILEIIDKELNKNYQDTQVLHDVIIITRIKHHLINFREQSDQSTFRHIEQAFDQLETYCQFFKTKPDVAKSLKTIVINLSQLFK